MKRNPWTHALFIAALLLLNIAIKFTLWAQSPQTFTDSLSYIAPATSLLDGRGYGSQENAYRTPTYPLFLAAILLPFNHTDLASCRQARVPACLGEAQQTPGGLANLRAIALVQIILGALTIPLIYGFAWTASHNHWIAALCALTHPIDLSTGYWEISILTEALTTFLLMLAVCLTMLAASATRYRLHTHIGLGIVLGALALCHPTFLFYAIVPAAFLWTRVIARSPSFLRINSATKQSPNASRGLLRFARNDVVPVLLIPALLVLAWSARNFVVDGFFTPSTLTGYNLTQMVGPFMEQAPAQYRDLAEIYVDTRAERTAAHGNHSGTIFGAYAEMLDARKTTWAGLSRDLTDLSVQLILHNPRGYLGVAWESFTQFWAFGLGRQNPGLPASFEWVKWFFDSRVQQGFTVLFFLSPLALVLARNWNRLDTPGALTPDIATSAMWIGFAMATVWFAALVSSAFNFGDNERYRAPVARLQYSAIILAAWYAIVSLRAKHPLPHPPPLAGEGRGGGRLLRRKERSSQ